MLDQPHLYLNALALFDAVDVSEDAAHSPFLHNIARAIHQNPVLTPGPRSATGYPFGAALGPGSGHLRSDPAAPCAVRRIRPRHSDTKPAQG